MVEFCQFLCLVVYAEVPLNLKNLIFFIWISKFKIQTIRPKVALIGD